MQPQYRKTLDARELLRTHPPRFEHPHKQLLFEMAYQQGTAPSAPIEVSRIDSIGYHAGAVNQGKGVASLCSMNDCGLGSDEYFHPTPCQAPCSKRDSSGLQAGKQPVGGSVLWLHRDQRSQLLDGFLSLSCL